MKFGDLLGASSTGVTTFGKVTATSPLTIQFNGTAAADAVAGVKKLDTYSATIGDTVALLLVGTTWLVLGEIT